MTGSRLAHDMRGELVCVAHDGQRWKVLGPTALGFEPKEGRAPTLEEMKGVRNPPMMPPKPLGNHRPRRYA